MKRERILFTGAAGKIGREVVPLLREHFALRLMDTAPIEPEGDDEVVQADIRDLNAFTSACRGVSALVHFAAVPNEQDFHTRLLPMNIEGAYCAFEAAREAGVPKIVFASSGTTVLGNDEDTEVAACMLPRPRSVYACTKLFGEGLARCYADKHGISSICLRIGWFQRYDSKVLRTEPVMLRIWCSPRDLAQIIRKSVQADIHFGIYFAVSDNPDRKWQIEDAREDLGFVPEDNAAVYFTGRE